MPVGRCFRLWHQQTLTLWQSEGDLLTNAHGVHSWRRAYVPEMHQRQASLIRRPTCAPIETMPWLMGRILRQRPMSPGRVVLPIVGASANGSRIDDVLWLMPGL